MITLSLLIVFLLAIVNGVLAMAELAVVSARRAKLKSMASEGSRGAVMALKLAEEPGRFLSTVQIGITLVGILSGAISGSTLGELWGAEFQKWGVPDPAANIIGITLAVVGIGYISLIVGELVPKQLALRNSERIAVALAPFMLGLAVVSGPFVTFLDRSGKLVLRLFGRPQSSDTRVTEEEIKSLVAEAESAGILDPEERQMIAGVMRLGQRPVRAVMTPRHDIDVIDLSQGPEAARAHILGSSYTRFLARESPDSEISGVILVKDLLDAAIQGRSIDPREHVKPAPTVMESMAAVDVVETLRASQVHLALVYDEYGHFEGVVTNTDILEAIIGESVSARSDDDERPVERADGSFLLAGTMPVDEVADLLGLKLGAGRSYSTVAGLVLAELKHLPKAGESVDVGGWRLEVVDLDGRRIDKILAQRVSAAHRAIAGRA